MSKQGEAREKQGYQKKPTFDRCRVCKNINSIETHDQYGYPHEKLRCGIGFFAVTANAVCDKFERVNE
jgi:hypothetical protein